MARTVSSLVNTSVDDCRVSIAHCKTTDLPMLRELLAECGNRGQKTRYTIVRTRINQLVKEQRNESIHADIQA